MPAITATAPGKIILFGEHAVVYGRPAIAAPVFQVSARAVVMANPGAPAGHIQVQAPEIGLDTAFTDLPAGHPLATVIMGVLLSSGLTRVPACTIRVSSTIPMAAGLGSGAAISVALARAFSTFCGKSLSDADINDLAYEVEKIHHGTPSGIDNTVITYAMPIYFVRSQPIERFSVARPFTIVIGDTGCPASTAETVSYVRAAWQVERTHYEGIFDRVGFLTNLARDAIEHGELEKVGDLMEQNHALLYEIGVSSPELEELVEAARAAGAWGAKLSGGGGGGNMIALVDADLAPRVAAALMEAGAVRTLITTITPSNPA